MFSKLKSALGGIALCAAASGCVVVEHGDAIPSGLLTTTWTIDGSSRPEECTYHGVDAVRVIIVDDAGVAVLDEYAACEDFDMSVDLSIGMYSTQVTLLDAFGAPVSDTVVVNANVLRDTETFVDVDFPATGIF